MFPGFLLGSEGLAFPLFAGHTPCVLLGTQDRLSEVTLFGGGATGRCTSGSGDMGEAVLEGDQGRRREALLSQVSISTEHRVPGGGGDAHWGY